MARSAASLDDLLPDSRWRQDFRRKLRIWFRKHARDLPWRHTSDPYAIWVSEIMLQQTQVETVKRYYQRFLAAFATINELADADESEVLRQWEGLGYYRRARQLHKAAQVVRDEYDGQFPQTFDEVLALPGIGRYTAGAILTFARGQRHPILEANTIRLHARLLGYDGPTTKAAGQKLLWAMAEAILPRSNPAEVNQAVMELGSLVCAPKNPQCDACPARSLCQAHALGRVADIPAATVKMKYEEVTEAAVVIASKGRVLLRRCQPHERWAGLWDFPRFAVAQEAGRRNRSSKPRSSKPNQTGKKNQTSKPNAALRRQLQQGVAEQAGQSFENCQHLTTIKHGVTKYRITLLCFTADATAPLRRKKSDHFEWVSIKQLDTYPLSVTGRKISQLLQPGN